MADNDTPTPPILDGRKLSNEELEEIRAMLERMDSFDAVTGNAGSDRGPVARSRGEAASEVIVTK